LKLVRDRKEAHWIPSRYSLALFRLMALLRFYRAKRVLSEEPRVYSLQRHQSTVEANTVCAWYIVTTAVYLFETLRGRAPFALVAVIALPLAAVLIHVLAIAVAVLVAAVTPRRIFDAGHASTIVSALLQLGHIAASLAMLRFRGPARWTALVALGVVGANLAAAVIMFFLRSRVEEIEKQYVGGPLFGE
jgi:hypothetical protein